jgi:hypothetical protein
MFLLICKVYLRFVNLADIILQACSREVFDHLSDIPIYESALNSMQFFSGSKWLVGVAFSHDFSQRPDHVHRG